jgi:hypothetical protein
MLCTNCGEEELTLKDADNRYSSLMCRRCGILIYYYETGQHLFVAKEEYDNYHKKKSREVLSDVKEKDREHREEHKAGEFNRH